MFLRAEKPLNDLPRLYGAVEGRKAPIAAPGLMPRQG